MLKDSHLKFLLITHLGDESIQFLNQILMVLLKDRYLTALSQPVTVNLICLFNLLKC